MKRILLPPVPDATPKGSPESRGYDRTYRSRRLHAIEVLFARQEGCCWLCGKPIDRGLMSPDPGSISLDHVDTTRGEGFNAMTNLKVAHRGCNSRRGIIERAARRKEMER